MNSITHSDLLVNKLCAIVKLVIFMNIKKIVVGQLEENCYILEKDGKYLVIDPGDEFEKIDAEIKGELEEILVTHNHFDHIGALKKLEKKYGLKANDYKRNTFKYEVIETPGHTSDSKTFYFPDENVMFTGDFLFYNSIGRMDLPTGSQEKMQQSLEKISRYPLDTKIYPGHFYSGVLKMSLEIAKNFFF